MRNYYYCHLFIWLFILEVLLLVVVLLLALAVVLFPLDLILDISGVTKQ